MSIKKNKKHLTLHGRIKIEAGIEKGESIDTMAHCIPTSVSTIYREIIRNRKASNARLLKCIHLKECIEKNGGKGAYCKYCSKFVEVKCERLSKFPFVCNGCSKAPYCTHSKYYYRADKANEKANKRLRESREGIKISKPVFEAIDNVISPLVKAKQSLNHILSTHEEIQVSERTLRNWINKGYTHAKNIDMPRVVRFKVKKEYNYRNTKNATILKNRTYIDYINYVKGNPKLIVSQFDSVLGLKTDKKRILTIHFPSIKFQFGLLLNNGTSSEVNRVLFELRSKMKTELWKKIFPIMLTDNGVEFNDLIDLEFDDNGEKVSSVFFTDPYRSGQKGSCERNHELFRYIQPKKHSIDYLTQNILNVYFSNINCYYRESLSGVRPYDLAKALFGQEFLDIIGIYEIKPDDVTFDKSKLLVKEKEA